MTLTPPPPQTAQELLATLQAEGVEFLRLQFTDILGTTKNVEVPRSQFEKALRGDVTFDGSAVEGFTRVEESDMLLRPDLATFLIYPPFSREEAGGGRVARLICDVTLPDGRPFEGDPRFVLKRQVERAAALGFEMFVGTEPEFFLFERDASGRGGPVTHDRAGYFDLAPIDKGERIRREITQSLVQMGFEIEAAHHEVAPGQHEIDFRYAPALETADRIATFKFVVKRVALEYGLLASFLPKPIAGVNGSGMHCHLSLFRDGMNAFADPDGEYGLSDTARHFIAGLLEHADGMTAITNPLVNSYKRLVPGYEAPVNVAWSTSNRSALIRIPAKRGNSTRAEVRMPDPSCNPYLALAAMLAAGLDGIEQKLEPPPAIQRNIFRMTVREKRHHRIRELPADLREAVDELEKDAVIAGALGEHVMEHFVAAKRAEWRDYSTTVHPWELERYLDLI
ncbi:type I glutamate--ammonia ligase [Deinococcus metallilatus]|uniref:Glutamine synthetase n=1 Tax=Deinococcus metallilatus TaxID=1211322 RepID=A0AAJ5K5A8_9DEIO|nr:type I glutamate--ammonia ligase [Deinococcus metallilatus]MBB5294221.1 glutamine synthetase [Deinococcus metallilatus]QBY08999.1 type I glutamate--ammonia ligase [Deinococcus metallilatus]RXJ10143.1 type I glutamate--ammonia ligase [Deinococcus metallilatus]TLK27920.1 type I glutamate--ammonia ligase [Deinococcus metallilatus]GMA16442.1 glutamine synthetase [Deinococcus metallilatus]